MVSAESSGEFSDTYVNNFDSIEGGIDSARVQKSGLGDSSRSKLVCSEVLPHRVTVEVKPQMRHMAVGPGEATIQDSGKANNEGTQTVPGTHSLNEHHVIGGVGFSGTFLRGFCSINVADTDEDVSDVSILPKV